MSIISFQLLFVSMLSPVIQQDEPFQEAHRQREYISPSGEFRLKAETAPGDFAFAAIYGPANCELTRNAETIWSYTLPHSLGPAAVFDDGTVVGVGTYGRKDARGMLVHLYFYVVIIDPSGTWLLNEYTRQRGFSTPHPTHLPRAQAMFVDYEMRRLWVVVLEPPENGRPVGFPERVLRVYDVDTGKKLSEIAAAQMCPNKEHGHRKLRICRATPIPDTDLMLVHAIGYDEKRATDGVFAVVDARGNLIWQDELTGDYIPIPGEKRYYGCPDFIGKPPVFGPGDTRGSFWIRSVHGDAKTKLEAIKNPTTSAWAVQKRTR